MEKKRGSEERRFERVGVSFIVSYKVDGPLSVRMSVGSEEFDATALDISEGGMALLSKHTEYYAIPTLTIVTVKFTMLDPAARKIGDRYNSMEFKGEVRSSVFLKEQKAYRLGVGFLGVTAQQRKFIKEFINMSSIRENKR